MTYLRKRFYDTCFLDLFSESSQNNRSASLTLGIYKIQWKQLNGITLGQRQTDTNNLLIIINKVALFWDLSIRIGFVPSSDLSVIP